MSPHINPRFRAYGKARLDIARRAHSREDWERLWKPTMHPFAFRWGKRWKHCIEYRVEDFAAEVGFFIDVLGFPVKAFNEAYAMFTSPDEAFYLAILPADERNPATPPASLRLQFMIAGLERTVEELARRGVEFSVLPQPISPGSTMHIAVFHTPHGLPVELWSETRPDTQPALVPESAERAPARVGERLPLAASPSPQDSPPPAAQRTPFQAAPPPEDVAPSKAAPLPAAPPEEPPAPQNAPAPPAPREESPPLPKPRPHIVTRRRRHAPRRSNRIPSRFRPVPTVAPPSPPPPKEDPLPDESLEPRYEDLPDARYPDDLP